MAKTKNCSNCGSAVSCENCADCKRHGTLSNWTPTLGAELIDTYVQHMREASPLTDTTRQQGVNPKDAIGAAKNPYGCISRAVLAEVGLAMMEGARKYGRHNYRVAPVRAEVYFDACNRHLDAWWEGEDIDPDSGLPHLVKAIACLFVIRDAAINDSWYDDRPPKVPWRHREYIKERTAEIIKKYPESKPPYTEINRKEDGNATE